LEAKRINQELDLYVQAGPELQEIAQEYASITREIKIMQSK
jgi:hypothetical protein